MNENWVRPVFILSPLLALTVTALTACLGREPSEASTHEGPSAAAGGPIGGGTPVERGGEESGKFRGPGAAASASGILDRQEIEESREQDTRDSEDLPTIRERTTGLQALPGLLPLWWDEAAGRLLLEPPPESSELLYYVSLPRGLGSNDVGLDRAQIGARQVVEFRRRGGRVLSTLR